jgi:hypothetical protein
MEEKYQDLDQLTALPNVLSEANLASHDIGASFQLIWPTAIIEVSPDIPPSDWQGRGIVLR